MVEQYTYSAYGDRKIVGSTSRDSAIGLTVGFTGLRNEGDLVFARGRYLSPSLGRWIGRDPMSYVDGYSLYQAYFLPNSLDPSGFKTYEFEETLQTNQGKMKLIYDDVKCMIDAVITLGLAFKNEGEWTQNEKDIFIGSYKMQVFRICGNSGKGYEIEIPNPKSGCCAKVKMKIKANITDAGNGEAGQTVFKFKDEDQRSNFTRVFWEDRIPQIYTFYLGAVEYKSKQSTLAHEFGHLIGLPHPSGLWSGFDSDYMADPGGIMGKGEEVRNSDLLLIANKVMGMASK